MADETAEESLPVPRGDQLTNEADILHRVLRTCFIDGDKVGSLNFSPGTRDFGLMSTDQASMLSAKESFDMAVSASLGPVGISAFTVKHVHAVELTAHADPETEPLNPAHAVVNFQKIAGSKTAVKRETTRRAKELRKSASAKGCVYPAGKVLVWSDD